MAVFMLSLTGVPPLAGFVGKFYLFNAAVNQGYVGLVIIAVLNSAVSAYYYLSVVVAMYMQEGGVEIERASTRPALVAAIAIAAIATIAIGLFPQPYIAAAENAFHSAARKRSARRFARPVKQASYGSAPPARGLLRGFLCGLRRLCASMGMPFRRRRGTAALVGGSRRRVCVGFDLDQHVGTGQPAHFNHRGRRRRVSEELAVRARRLRKPRHVGDEHPRADDVA